MHTTSPQASSTPRLCTVLPLLIGLVLSVFVTVPAQSLERLVLVRHAEKVTPWPRDLGTFQPLTEAGEARADSLVEHFRDGGLVAVVTSPTSRTVLTGMPVAKALEIPIRADARSLDPSQFKALVSELQEQHPNAEALLLVAHSNTIPLWLRHFGADASCHERLGFTQEEHGGRSIEVIEGYAGVWTVNLGKSGCAALERSTQPMPDATPEDGAARAEHRIHLDPTHLPLGQATYALRHGREPMGLETQTVTNDTSGLRIEQVLGIARAGIELRTETRYVTEGAADLESVRVTGPVGPSTAEIAVEHTEGHLRGHTDYPRSRRKPAGRLDVDQAVPRGIFTLGSLQAVVPAMPILEESPIVLWVYDPTDDSLSELRLTVGEPTEVTVPAGTFETVPVIAEPLDPDAQNAIRHLWVSTDSPRRTVRLELENQGWTYDLVRVGAAESESATP